eukprot:gene1836-2263_t
MAPEATLKQVLERLAKALAHLEDAVDMRLEQEGDFAEAEEEVQRMNMDRRRLAQELDASEGRAERLEAANKEVSRRLVTAMESIRTLKETPMATVTVTIDGKAYRMACDEGQEQHLTGLAERFDRYVTHLKSSFGEIGDLRLTVMAGIMITDELHELQMRVKGLENEADALRKSRDEALQRADKNDTAITGVLSEVTTRIENLAAKIAPKAT